MGLCGEAGEACDKVKKIWRNTGQSDPKLWSVEQQDSYKKELGDVFWYLANCCSEAGISLDEVALGNLEKLNDRRSRGVIKSEGDTR